MKGPSGSIHKVVVVFERVSEEFQLNRELKKYDAQYKIALKGSSLGLWEWVRTSDTISFSEQSRQILGLHANTALVSLEEWKYHLYSNDQKHFYVNFHSSFKSDSPLYQDEFRIVSKDEGLKWILAKGMIVSRDEDGTPFRMIGTIADITKRRQAEEALRIERDNFVNIFKSMKDGVIIVNNRYRIQYINPALKKDFGDPASKKCYEYLYQRKTKCPLCEISKAVAGDKIHKEA